MKMPAIFAGLACLILSVAIVGCSKKDKEDVEPKDEVKTFVLAHGLNAEHPVHKAMEHMSNLVDAKSGGKLKVDVHSSESLGTETECIERLQIGRLDMTKTSSSPLEGFIEEMKVLGLPYVFRDSEHFWKVMNGEIGKELLAAGENIRLKGLCFYDAGARSFYTAKKPIRTPVDLKDMKIRVQQSPVAMDLVRAFGASPTPIAWGELYTSLAQGVVDGAENNPPSLYTSKHYEICKYYTLDQHTRPADVLMMSMKAWNKLTAQEQKILQEAADESVVFQRKAWAEFEKESMDAVKAAGVEVIEPDKEAFKKAVEPMYKEYEGTKIGDLVKRIREVE